MQQDGVPLLQYTDDDDDYHHHRRHDGGGGGKKSKADPPDVNSPARRCSKGKDRRRRRRHENLIRDARVRWFLLSKRGRVLVVILGSLLLFHILVGICDLLFWSFDRTAPAVGSATGFDVVINTFQRPEMLADAVRHYADTCGVRSGVSHIYVVWAEEGVTPPSTDSFFRRSTMRHTKDRSGVSVLQVANSLNSRFLPIEGVQDAVFMVDDDIRVDCRNLRAGFAAWKAHPNSLVGYYPRLARKRRLGSRVIDLVYQSWPIVFFRNRMNIILTKACFLHQRYLGLYSSDNHPKQIKDFVDKFFNCEDIAMAMLVANVTKHEFSIPAQPIYVEGKVSDLGLFNGISTGTGHMAQRSDCLNELTAIYRDHGWDAPLDSSFALADSSWLRHSPGFWWQSRPSNFFEWFALSNVLK